MNKIRFLILIFVFISLGSAAQRQNLYFLKNSGQYVKLRDSADYLRIVKEPEEGSELYGVTEHYLDGTTKSAGYSSKIDPPVYEGQYISYYKNGKKRFMGIYKKGKLIDTAYSYYPNGSLYTVTGYSLTADNQILRYIKSVKDTTGKDLVTNGNGECVFYDSEFKGISERGRIKNGLYEGEWLGEASRAGAKYKEVYVGGQLLSGESTDRDGTVYTYTKVRVDPQFKNGINAFYTYLKKNIRYPEQCFKNGIQGKVLLRFTVLTNGSLEKISVMNDVHPALAMEAVRVIRASPLWEPGSIRGKPANVIYNVPVSFTLRR